MQQSVSICTGLHAFSKNEYKTANNGWTLQDRLADPCFIAGLTVVHRYDDPFKLLKVYQQLRGLTFKANCEKRKSELDQIIQAKWGAYETKFIKTEWENNFENVMESMTGYTV